MAGLDVFFTRVGAGGTIGKTATDWPDPFCDYASTQMPNSLEDVFRWCEYLWLTNSTYRMAVQRIVRFFITRLELTGVSEEEVKKYTEFLSESMQFHDILSVLGDDYMAYGNSLSSVYMPFDRFLLCPKCHAQVPIQNAHYEFKKWRFIAYCPVCKRHQGVMPHLDRRSLDNSRIKIIRWSPHEVRMQYNPISGESAYIWQIPGEIRSRLERGDKIDLETTPWEVVEACKDNKLFRFNPDVVYHMKEQTLAGVRNNGWGIPRMLSVFKDLWYVQVLKKYNEALALDFIVPFRIITPANTRGGMEGDPLLNISGASFRAQAEAMIAQHRQDPLLFHTFPFPVQYQLLGGEGKQLAPHELIEAATTDMLNGVGVPAELYRGTIQVQAAPTALRLFESTWRHLVASLNGYINWFLLNLSENMSWERARASLQKSTMAEDLEKKQILLQLAAGGQVSRTTAFAPLDIEFRDEVRRMLNEERFYQDAQQKFQREQQESQELSAMMAQGSNPFAQAMSAGGPGATGGMTPMGGVPGAAGLPPGAGGIPMPVSSHVGMAGSQITPEDMMMQAEQVAQQLIAMPESLRKSELIKMKKSNETLHALVIAKINDMRRQMQMQGGAMLQQQMQSGMM